MACMKIDEVCPKREGNPIVVNFLNAYPTDAMKSLPCTILQDSVTKEKVYVCEIDDMLYTGKIVKDMRTQTTILKRDRITGRVTVIGVDCLEMKPELPEEKKTFEYNTSDFNRMFGSNKQKLKKNKTVKPMNTEIMTEHMANVANKVQRKYVDLAAFDSYPEDFYIPPIDRTALNIHDVYDINRILNNDEFEKIYSEIDGSMAISDMKPWVQGLIAGKDMSLKLTILAVYADCLLNLYSTKVKDINKKSFLACPYSKTLNNIILKNFTIQSNGKFLRSGPYKDKSFCYAVVLILLINDLEFDLDGLCQVLKLSAKTASIKVRATGAKIVNKGGKKAVQLKLPLNTQTLRQRTYHF